MATRIASVGAIAATVRVLALTLLLALGLAAALKDFQSVLHRSQIANLRIAENLASQITPLFQDAEHSLADLAPSPAAAATREQAVAAVQSRKDIVEILLTDQNGTILWSTRNNFLLTRNFRDQDVFQKLAGGEDALIDVPVPAQDGDHWLVPMARAIHGGDGRFAGMLAVFVDAESIVDRPLQPPDDVAIGLFHRNGMLLAHYPMAGRGDSFARSADFRSLVRAGSGFDRSRSEIDGLSRLIAYAAVPGFPLVVAVVQPQSAALSDWYRHLLIGAALMLGLAVLGLRSRS